MLITIPTRLSVVIDELILKLMWKATSPRQAQQSTIMIEKYQVGGITLPNFTGQIISSQNKEYMSMSLKILYGQTAIILHFRRYDEVRNLERKSSTWSTCVCAYSAISNSVTLQTTACQVPLSKEFFRQRMLEWVAIFSSRGSSQPRDRILAGRFFYPWATREALVYMSGL